MASLVFQDLNKRLLGLSCSSTASTSIVVSGRAIDRHSPPHLRDPDRRPKKVNYTTSSSSKKKKKSKQPLVSPASSSRFLLNSSRMQPKDDNIIIHELELPPPPFIPVDVAEAASSWSSSSSSAVVGAAEENEIAAVVVGGEKQRESSSSVQVVVLRVSLHCKGCAGKVKKHISRMEGVTSLDIDIATKKVTVVGDVTPLAVLSTVSKIKPAQFWPTPSLAPQRASASF